MPTASHPPVRHTSIRIVQSRNNGRVKELRAALSRPSAGLIGLEGGHLVEEALRSGLDVRTIFVRKGSEALLDSLARDARTAQALASVPEILSLPEDVLQSAVTTETPQAVAALAVPPAFSLDRIFASSAVPLLLVLAGLQDPGNVGTILRSAEAFGVTGVFALAGTASVWNAKSLRASMGSAFRLPVVTASVDETLAALQPRGIVSLAAVAPAHAQAKALRSVDLRPAIALWIGNEGSGLAPELIARCAAAVTIPCPGHVESLNAAIAASVLVYEASCQRQAAAQAVRNVSRPCPKKEHPNPA